MIQRRVKWKKGVAVENGCMQAGKGLGNSRKAGDGGLGGEGMGCCRLFQGLERQHNPAVKSWSTGVRLLFTQPMATY